MPTNIRSSGSGTPPKNIVASTTSANTLFYTVPEGRVFEGYLMSTSTSRGIYVGGDGSSVWVYPYASSNNFAFQTNSTYGPGTTFSSDSSTSSGPVAAIGIERDLA